jgi:hypothetical protein
MTIPGSDSVPQAMIAARSQPTASSTAPMSSAQSSQVGIAERATPSEAPVPRRSNATTRPIVPRRRKYSASAGVSQFSSTWVPNPQKYTMSTGPDPNT